MNIKTRKAKIVNEVDECVAELTPDEVEEAIKEYVEKKGPDVIKTTFNTKWSYESDEWGMNSNPRSTFTGATVLVKPSEYKG